MKKIIYSLMIATLILSGCNTTDKAQKENQNSNINTYQITSLLNNENDYIEVGDDPQINDITTKYIKTEHIVDKDKKRDCHEIDGSTCVNGAAPAKYIVQNITKDTYLNYIPLSYKIDSKSGPDSIMVQIVSLAPEEVIFIDASVENINLSFDQPFYDKYPEDIKNQTFTKEPIQAYQKDLKINNVKVVEATKQVSFDVANKSKFPVTINQVSGSDSEIVNKMYYYSNYPSTNIYMTFAKDKPSKAYGINQISRFNDKSYTIEPNDTRNLIIGIGQHFGDIEFDGTGSSYNQKEQLYVFVVAS